MIRPRLLGLYGGGDLTLITVHITTTQRIYMQLTQMVQHDCIKQHPRIWRNSIGLM